jgi:hypothetical protein
MLQNAEGIKTPTQYHYLVVICDNVLISDCGTKGSGRIINGTEATENEFPWMCSVNYNDNSVRTLQVVD